MGDRRRAAASSLAAIALLATSWSAPASAEPRALPEFTVLAKTGERHRGAALSPQRRWLLIYTTPDCRPCEALLRALKGARSADLLARTVLVVGAALDEAEVYANQGVPAEFRGLPWYADAEGRAWETLDLHGAPVVLGVMDGRIEWALSGVLAGSDTLRAAVRHWTGEPAR